MRGADHVSGGRSRDDPELLSRISARDVEALGELYDRYGRVVFGVLYQMLPTPEVAEEVVQDAFHAVWRRARTYRPERGAVRTWLLAIARNAAIDWRRSRGRRMERERPLDVAADRNASEAVDDPVERSLRSADVRRALAVLPPEQREVLVLAFFRGLSQSEIAARVGIPLGTVKGRARLGMARLRQSLSGEAPP